MKIALDSNIFIYVLNGNVEYVENCVTILKLSSSIKLITSALILLESVSSNNIEDIRETSHLLYGLIYSCSAEIIAIDNEILLESGDLRRTYNLKTPDAIHLATSIVSKADYFVTNDKQLLALKKVGSVKIVSIKKAALLI